MRSSLSVFTLIWNFSTKAGRQGSIEALCVVISLTKIRHRGPECVLCQTVTLLRNLRICESMPRCLWMQEHELRPGFVFQVTGFATSRAYCYCDLRQIEKVEETYLQGFHGSKKRLQLWDEITLRVARELIGFHENIDMLEKAIIIGQEVWKIHSTMLGTAHSLTPEVLYLLGNYCTITNPTDAEH